jgi:hypothetical protein
MSLLNPDYALANYQLQRLTSLFRPNKYYLEGGAATAE